MDAYKTFTLIRNQAYRGYFGNVQYKGKKVLWEEKVGIAIDQPKSQTPRIGRIRDMYKAYSKIVCRYSILQNLLLLYRKNKVSK